MPTRFLGHSQTGSRHARRLLVEAAWHDRRPAARGHALKRRQAGQSAHVLALSWKAQRRLHQRWQRLETERGKRSTIVAVAVARELAGFCWAIATAD
jgi:transposase